MKKYLVKFIDPDYLPDFGDPAHTSIKLGTFHHYRAIEDETRRDSLEGQRGVHIEVKRPSKKLGEFGEANRMPGINDLSRLDDEGNFTFRNTIQVHDHLAEFNAWIYSVSALDDLAEVERLAETFDTDGYFFINDIDCFANAVQRSLAEDLKRNPRDEGGSTRVLHGDASVGYIDGFKNFVDYSYDSQWMKFEVATFDEFLEKHSRTVDQRFWFTKPNRFVDEKEFRFAFFGAGPRTSNIRYSTTDDFVILDVDLTGCVSEKPVQIEFKRIDQENA